MSLYQSDSADTFLRSVTSSGRSRPLTPSVSRLPETTDRPSTSELLPSPSSSPTLPSALSRPPEFDLSPSQPSPTVLPVVSSGFSEKRVPVPSTPGEHERWRSYFSGY
jgi:hypothetical protein